jgi:hypothetical protein
MKFTRSQREQLKQLVIEADCMRLSQKERHVYVQSRFGHDVAMDTINHIKLNIRRSIGPQLDILRKHNTAFIEQYFNRIHEVEKLQQEQWALFIKNGNNPMIQHLCLKELHSLTVTLSNMWDIIPKFTGMSRVEHFGRETVSQYLERNKSEGQEPQFRTEIPV